MKQNSLTAILACCTYLIIACDKGSPSIIQEPQQTNVTTPSPPPNNNNGNNNGYNCITDTEAVVTQVSGPSSTQVNTEVVLQVKFAVNSGCGNFGHFEKTEADFTHNIKVIARYEGCICTANAPVRTTSYLFKATTPGVYYLKFKKSAAQSIIHQIHVKATPGN